MDKFELAALRLANFSGPILEIVWGHAAKRVKYIRVTSTREKLLAILASVYVMEMFQDIYGAPINNLEVKIVTDSVAAKNIRERSANNEYYEGDNHHMMPKMDVDNEIETVLKSLKNLNVHYIWTKGHNDKADEQDHFYTKINQRVDKLATSARKNAKKGIIDSSPYPFLPGCLAAVEINGEVIHNQLKQVVIEHCDGDELKQHMQVKYKWDDDVFETIHWEAQKRSLQTYKQIKRTQVYKYIHGWLHTNKRRYIYAKRRQDKKVQKFLVWEHFVPYSLKNVPKYWNIFV